MPQPWPDPSPRSYPPGVTLIARGARGPAAAPAHSSPEATEAWLLGPAARREDLLGLVESLAWRLVAAGLAVDRLSLHIGTLHPQLLGFGWTWSRADGLCDEVRVAETLLRTDSYRRNPLYRVIGHGERVHLDLRVPGTTARFPLMAELAAQGIVEYLAVPLGDDGRLHNAATVATCRPEGFSAAALAALERLLALFALHVERHIALRVAGNALETYLGAAAGARVLEGSIKRGAGETIRAVLWASDLRGFTGLADRLPGDRVTLLLNAYLAAMAGAVLDQGGEVLKFIGDGLLAVFPFTTEAEGARAATAALAAGRAALARLDALNRDPPEALLGIEGWRPLRTGIALHEGEVFFGNVGAPGRLDFTVIGRAVNEAARVEGLSKILGRPLLVTGPVARRLGEPMAPLGSHVLRGAARPMEVLAPTTSDGREESA